MSDFDRLLAFGKVFATTVGGAAKQVLVNVRAFADADTDDAEAEGSNAEPMFGALGVISRPLPPSADGHAEVIAARREDGLQPFAGRDLRVSKARGSVNQGSHNLAGYHGAFVGIEPAASGDGDTVTIYVPFSFSGDTPAKAHTLTLDPTPGAETIALAHASGCALFMNKNDELVLRNKNGSQLVTMRADEIAITGVIKLFGGVIAGNSGTALPVALYPAVAAAATALALAATSAAAAFTALAAIPALAAAAAALGTAATNATAAATACTALAVPATGASQTLKASPV
jgi:hypothetical protein